MARTAKDYSETRKYLAKVLPWPQADDPPAHIGIHYKVPNTDSKEPPFWWRSRGVSSVADAARTIDWLSGLADTRDIYVCIASLTSGTEKTSAKGHKYYTVTREHTHVQGLKALVVDLDAKGADDDSYDTLEEAVTDLFRCLKAIKFPAPSCMVRTGGGVHAYWTLDRILAPAEWLPLAEALKNALLQHGLKFDAGCTSDTVHVFRPPRTLNHKFDPPVEVRLAGEVTDFDYSVKRIEIALVPYRTATRKVTPGKSHVDLSGLPPLKPIDDDTLSAGIEDFSLPKPPLLQVARACPFVKQSIQTGGADNDEPRWYATMQLALWTEEGRASAHVMSDQHPGYVKDKTDDKYDEAVNAQAAKKLGWPQCSTIAGLRSKPCVTCGHRNKGKSPLNFVTLQQPQPTYQPSSVNPILNNADIPIGYQRDAAGHVLVGVTADDGSVRYVRVNDYIMIDPWISRGSPRMLNFTTETEMGARTTVQLNTAIIGGMEMRSKLQEIGVMLSPDETKKTGAFFVAWTKRLKDIKDAVTAGEPYGWVGKDQILGFAYGGTLYTPQGPRVAAQAEAALANIYTPTGDLTPWYDAVNLVHNQKRMPLDAIIAASFAAPLIRSTGQPGLLLSLYSLESGAAKTTAMQCGQAVWGHSVNAMQGLDDTPNSVIGKLGKLRHLPMFWDELKTSKDAQQMVNTVFTITRGHEKSRMLSSTALREMGSWETLIISASNESMVDHIVNHTKMTAAGIYRLFEFATTPSTEGRIAISDASRIISNLKSNYGAPGRIYAEFLGRNHQRVDQEVAAEMLVVGKDMKIEPDERFWAALVAVVVLGAKYANELGLTRFDLKKLRTFMYERFEGMRQLRDMQSVDMRKDDNISNLLSQYLRDMRARHMLTTDVMWMGRGKPKTNAVKIVGDATKIDALTIHVALKDKRMRISVSSLTDWLVRREFPQHIFFELLKSKFGAVRTLASLGAGTSFSIGAEYVFDFDLTRSSLKKFLPDYE
jgi:hypothetical protein